MVNIKNISAEPPYKKLNGFERLRSAEAPRCCAIIKEEVADIKEFMIQFLCTGIMP